MQAYDTPADQAPARSSQSFFARAKLALVQLAPVWFIIQREVRDQFRDWRIIVPVVLLSLIFPAIAYFLSEQALAFIERYGGQIVGERLIPFLMLIVGFFPVSISLAVALESFVGEKERRSIEPLLSSPLADWQLYLGKLAASLILPLFSSYLGTVVFLFGAYSSLGWTPPPMLLVQTIVLVFVQTLLLVSGAVAASSQATSIRAANLLSSFIVLPMALLIQVESIAIFWGDEEYLWYSAIGQTLLAGLLIRMGVSHFNREELLGRELDTLNIQWAWHTFRKAFTGQARSIGQWYRMELPITLRKLRLPALLTLLLFLAGLGIGSRLSTFVPVIDQPYATGALNEQIQKAVETLPFFDPAQIPVLWLHNMRAVVLATFIGIFTFSVGGMLVLMLPAIIIGFILSQATRIGLSPGLMLAAFVLPHGIIEIPVLVLTGAAILRMGGALVAPVKNLTFGESFLISLADWARVFIGLVIPLLLAAAVFEVLVTPRVALWLFQ